MKEFIKNLFNTIGLGVGGIVKNIESDKVKEMFPDYSFKAVKNSPTETFVSVIDKNEDVPFVCKYTHTEGGRITHIIIAEP